MLIRVCVVWSVVVTIAVASPAWAQQSSAGGEAGSVALTYNVLRLTGQTSAAGIGLDVARRVARSRNGVDVQIAGNLAVGRFGASDDYDASTVTTFLLGVRLVGRGSPKAAPFAHALFGGLFCCGETDRALNVGGGVDVPLSNSRAAFRAQVDVPVAYYPAGVDFDGAKYDAGHDLGLRFSVGVAIPFGR